MNVPPFFFSPITDLFFFMAPLNLQGHKGYLCAKIELRLYECIEAYGVLKAREKCAELLYDRIECAHNSTQRLRSEAIYAERMKKYREGKIDKPFEEHPPLDSYLYL